MKPQSKNGIRLPQLPKHLPMGELSHLEDFGQYMETIIAGADFSTQEGKNFQFEQTHLRQVVFQQSRLTNFSLMDSVIERSDLSGARWEKGRFRRVEMTGCRLLGSSLMEGMFEDVYFKDCNAESANFITSTFKNVRFENCNLRGVSFEGADLTGVVFFRCDLSGSIFLNSIMKLTDLRSSVIDDMSVGINELRGAIFSPSQAVQVAGLLGITIKDWEEEDYQTGR